MVWRKALGIGSVVLLFLALGACRQNPVVPPSQPIDLDAPGILRGVWTGVGVSSRYQAPTFSNSGTLFGAGTQEGYKVWDTESGEVRWTLPAAQPTSAVFSLDDNLIAFRDPSTIRIISAETGDVLVSKALLDYYANAPVFSPDSSRLLIKVDEAWQLWRLERTGDSASLVLERNIGQHEIQGTAAFSPDGASILIGERSGATLYRMADGTTVQHYVSQDYGLATFAPDGSVFIGGSDGVVHYAVTGEQLGVFSQEGFNTYNPSVSPDGRYLVSSDSGLFIWDIASGEKVAEVVRQPRINFFNDPPAFAFSGNGGALYTASSNGEVVMRSVSAGGAEVLGQLQSLFRTESFDLSLDLSATTEGAAAGYYDLSGTFQFGDEAALPLTGSVCVPQNFYAQTSPGYCEVGIIAGDAAAPEWTGRAETPQEAPVVLVLDASRGADSYHFEVQPQDAANGDDLP